MHTSTRILLAGFVSVLALGVMPVQSASAAPVRPAMVGCCR